MSFSSNSAIVNSSHSPRTLFSAITTHLLATHRLRIQLNITRRTVELLVVPLVIQVSFTRTSLPIADAITRPRSQSSSSLFLSSNNIPILITPHDTSSILLSTHKTTPSHCYNESRTFSVSPCLIHCAPIPLPFTFTPCPLKPHPAASSPMLTRKSAILRDCPCAQRVIMQIVSRHG